MDSKMFNCPVFADYLESLDLSNCEKGGLRTKSESKKNSPPLISLITVVYNGEKYLQKAIESIICQKNDRIEYIIIDGGSNDSTLDIIKNNESSIDFWISQKDSGIYDAYNKGIVLAKGKLVKFINADDELSKDSIVLATEIYLNSQQRENILINSDLEIIDRDGELLEVWSVNKKQKYFPVFLHPTWYLDMEIYKRIGLYCTDFKISSDYEYYLRLLKNNVQVVNATQPLSKYRNYGVSLSYGGVKEVFKINYSYFGLVPALYVAFMSYLGKTRQRLVRTILGKHYSTIKKFRSRLKK